MGYGICGAHGLHSCDINLPPPDTSVGRGFAGYVFYITPCCWVGSNHAPQWSQNRPTYPLYYRGPTTHPSYLAAHKIKIHRSLTPP
jgi:hypothetical protein